MSFDTPYCYMCGSTDNCGCSIRSEERLKERLKSRPLNKYEVVMSWGFEAHITVEAVNEQSAEEIAESMISEETASSYSNTKIIKVRK